MSLGGGSKCFPSQAPQRREVLPSDEAAGGAVCAPQEVQPRSGGRRSQGEDWGGKE